MSGMNIIRTDHITAIEIEGQHAFRVETSFSGDKFVYIGDECIVMTAQQYREFAVQVFNHK